MQVRQEFIRALDLNTPTTIEGTNITVTLLDANHCPGSVMFVLQEPGRRPVVVTGDFKCAPMSPGPRADSLR